MAAARDILFLSQRVPYPPDRGDRITTWHILSRMLDAGHRLRAGCFLESPEEEASVAELRRLGVEVFWRRLRPAWRRVWSLPWLATTRPLTVPYFMHAGLRRDLAASLRARPADACYAYSSSMGFYMLALRRELERATKVAHFAELDSDKWAQFAQERGFPGRWVYGREAHRLLEWEDRLARFATRCVVVSPVEAELFRRRIAGVPVAVLPNGVDLEAFRPGGEREPRTIVFTGVMSYHPNADAVQWFVREAWPQVRARFPDARFWIVGSAPGPAVLALDGRDGIQVTGRVPSTADWLRRASVGLATLRIARGVQNKVLEAMASGLPVVVTPKALEGIDAVPGEHVVLAADAPSIAAAVNDLFAAPQQAAALGAAARRLVEERYDWSKILAGLDAIFA
jgi:sugar transferase (PEP-CTERM/EpsH1 system associated)